MRENFGRLPLYAARLALVLAGSTSALGALAQDSPAKAPVAPSAALAEPAVVAPTPEIEAVIERLKADLAKRNQVPSADIRTISAASVVWRDTSMGCGKPNELYAQIDVAGYEVVLEHGGRRFDYKVRKDGTFILC